MAFDVVIPSTEKDLSTLNACIRGARDSIRGVERLFVVSKTPLTTEAIWVPESAYPFTFSMVGAELFGGDVIAWERACKKGFSRTGWYLQQLLKLYAPTAIPDLSEHYLVLDSDVVFFKDAQLFVDGVPCYTKATENHPPYVVHMGRLLPGLHRMTRGVSGVAHHMILSRPVLRDLMGEVQDRWQEPFWKMFLRCVEPKHRAHSGASEYEIYFNYLQWRGYAMRMRDLIWMTSSSPDDMPRHATEAWHYVVYPAFLR